MWLMSILAACTLCSVAQALMPPGAVKRVGGLVCGLVLLCVVLSPAAGLDLEEGQRWMDNYFAGVDKREEELEDMLDREMKTIIEQEYAAYIVDKATEMGLTCTARVICRVEEGLYLPDCAEVFGLSDEGAQARLAQVVSQDLGIPLERQSYAGGEELP